MLTRHRWFQILPTNLSEHPEIQSYLEPEWLLVIVVRLELLFAIPCGRAQSSYISDIAVLFTARNELIYVYVVYPQKSSSSIFF